MGNGLENLSSMEYPGRVIVIGRDASGNSHVVIYAMTGRSPSSQSRRLELKGNTIFVKPTDEETLKKGNVKLLIYPAIIFSQGIAVSNGKQTADILTCLGRGKKPVEVLVNSLERWDYEPDPPIYTPRISGCVSSEGKAALSIIKRSADGPSVRYYFEVPMAAGKGKMIATYGGENREPLPVFEGEPVDLHLEEEDARSMTKTVYKALEPEEKGKDFRVSVACVFASVLHPDRYEVHIMNRADKRE